MERITHVMLDSLENMGWIRENLKDGFWSTGTWYITDEGRKVAPGS